jgi:hypothetical protein
LNANAAPSTGKQPTPGTSAPAASSMWADALAE